VSGLVRGRSTTGIGAFCRVRCACRSTSGGFVLIEFMVALLLMSIVLTAMCSAYLQARARVTALARDAASAVAPPVGGPSSESAALWHWGPRVGRVMWEPGPTLSIDRRAPGTSSQDLLGLWVEGWFVGEFEVGPASFFRLGPAEGGWGLRPGGEVVVRARRAGEPWGAPVRTMVGLQGDNYLPNTGIAPGTGHPFALTVHPPAAGLITFRVSAGGGAVALGSDSGPLGWVGMPAGPLVIEGLAHRQALYVDCARDVDVYF